MPSDRNRHGLTRHIPADVKRRVRQECGFGCVCCGLAIAMYEHIEPEFANAREHDPAAIAYLCGSCHDRVTRGVWSKQKVWEARKSPYCIRNGGCWDAFDIESPGNLAVRMGSNLAIGFNKLLTIEGRTLLGVERPETPGGPYRLTAAFYDADEQLRLEIDGNDWKGPLGAADIECVGRTITIRTSPDEIALQLTSVPRMGVWIRKLNMTYKRKRFHINDEGLSIFDERDSRINVGNRIMLCPSGDGQLLSGNETSVSLGGGGNFTMTDSSMLPGALNPLYFWPGE